MRQIAENHVKLKMRPYLSALLACLMVSVLFAQDPQVRVRVDLVTVPVSVRGDGGRLVGGLQQTDFSISEDGQPQTIASFSADPQPLSAVILIDTGMGGISMRRLVPLFISVTGGFSEFDEMAAFRYDHFVFQLSDFTSDHEQIEKSFKIVKDIAEKQPATVPSGAPAPTAPKIIQMLLGFLNSTPAGGGGSGPIDPTRPPTQTLPTVQPRKVAPSRVLFDAIHDAAEALATRPPERRRIILIISDGQVSGTNAHSYGEVTDLLLRDNIQLFAVTTDSAAFEGRFGVLGALAKATGGDEYRGLSTNAMESAFSRITEEARNQYVLGYYSTNKNTTGAPVVRLIDVKGRESKWKVTHRKGYTQQP